MIAITTKSSISVKPERTRLFMSAPPFLRSVYYDLSKDNTARASCKGVALWRLRIRRRIAAKWLTHW
jgi:hypothetical protein